MTVKSKSVLTVPPEVRRKAGIKIGDRLEFRVSGGIITILPDLRSADGEYTKEQRSLLDKQLAAGLDDIRKGRVSPKFETVEEMLTSLKADRSPSPRQKKSRGR